MIYSIISKYATLLTQFIVIFSTFQLYGAGGRGVIAGLFSVFTLVGIALSFTIGRGFLYMLSKEESNEFDLIKSVLLLGFTFSFITVLMHSFFIGFYPEFYGKIEGKYVLIFLLSSFYYLWVQVSQHVYSGIGKLDKYNTQTLVLAVAQAFLCVCAYFFAWGLELFIALVSITMFCFTAINWFYLHLYTGNKVALGNNKAKIVKSGLKLHIDTIGGYLLGAVSVFVVNFYLTLEDVAVYDLYIKVFSLFAAFPQVVQLFFNRFVFRKDMNGNVLTRQLRIFKVVTVLYSVMVIFVILSAFYIPQVDPYVAGTLLIAFVPYYWCSIIAPLWIRFGDSLRLSFVTVSIGIVGVIIMVFGVKEYGIYGASCGFLFTYITTSIVNLIYYRIKVKKELLIG
jgi:O-antigen/teichoic acid export membrane protein